MTRMLYLSIISRHSIRLASTNLPQAGKVPEPKEVTPQNAQFDQVTHTGQAWDQADYRLARYEYNPKTINPNIAAHLIAEIPPKAVDERVVSCGGGETPALGHPLVFINLDKPGTHACGYCGQRFYNTHVTTEKDLSIHHIEC
uniref:Zinc finger CHCC-type domain-containing protein n=1 Tax=Panagrolaimus superbus TaxID=310955 RepID=A0A914YRR0_9BILA